ncbi:hypothetical protein ART_2903 [Arthrobacter sp. PAMC 25486]|nr:hypothetical protein ART_2903 [Arthrobacter sp. PAMC 25486]
MELVLSVIGTFDFQMYKPTTLISLTQLGIHAGNFKKARPGTR